MRDARGVCLTRDKNVLNDEHGYAQGYFIGNIDNAKDFECQCKIDLCTCKRMKHRERYFNSQQVYRSQRYTARGFADVGVGSVKTVCRKRVKRIYLPESAEKAVGLSDISIEQRKPYHCESVNCGSTYLTKRKTSSKCVGGVAEYVNVNVLSKALSPIIKKISNSTSPIHAALERTDVSSQTIRIDKQLQIQNIKALKSCATKKMLVANSKVRDTPTNTIVKTDGNIIDGRNLSSDSLVQHVHNLENPSNDKLRNSNDFIENKLEREYRKIFTTDRKGSNSNNKDKSIPELKSASMLRRRFEALRRGLNKKEKPLTIKNSSKLSIPSKKDVSIASDPPSLESRSYSNIKVYSPVPSMANACNAPMSNPSYSKSGVDEKETPNWPTDPTESDCQDVKDMFRLWGKKFNLEESSHKTTSKKQKKKVQLELGKDKSNKKEKGEGRRFLFFGKKNKNKPKQNFRPKQGVTAGRCELGDGLMIKIGAVNKYTAATPVEKINDISEDYIIGKDWFKRYISKKIDSRNSVKIRWNNSMYTTSSSTVFELMDCVYKNTGVIFSSKSEVTTGESSNYNSYKYPKVSFLQQNIQAWMIPKTITDKPVPKTSVSMLYPKKKKDKNIEITFSDQKWFIEKSKAFSRKVEFVLHSKNVVKNVETESSEYIVIDIPQNYFSDTSSDEKNNNTSDEQVYNIVEYEKLNSNSYLNKKNVQNTMDTKDRASKDIQVTVSVKDNKGNEEKILESNNGTQDVYTNVHPSNTYNPKARDVISVRIITQRDIRDIKKPILKINSDLDDKSSHVLPPSKKCDFAESFLQDYYRDLSPLGIDLLSWCVSNNELRGSPGKNSLRSFRNQGDGSKSCSHIYDDYQASTIVSSCETSSCSHCKVIENEKKLEDSKSCNFFSKLMKKSFDTILKQHFPDKKRASPKDSLEVFKRRKIYAASNKSKWGVNEDVSEPYFPPDCPKDKKSSLELCPKPKKKCKKKVLLQDDEVMDVLLKKQMSDITVEGILAFKGASGCDTCKTSQQKPKQANVIPEPICEIPQPPCKVTCIKQKEPPCSKKNSPSCDVPTPSSNPVEPPPPCPGPCPPDSPARQSSSSALQSKTPSGISLTKSPRECIDPQPTPPVIHSPIQSSPKTSHVCVCPKMKISSCDIPNCPVSKKSSCISTPPCISASTSHESVSKCKVKSPRKTKSPEKCNKSSSHDFPWPLKKPVSNTPSKESGCLKITPAPCATQKSSSKCIPAFKRLIQKSSNSSFKEKDCKPDCANRRKVQSRVQRPCPPAPPPTLASAPTPNKCASKMPGLYLKKLPMPRSLSKECIPQHERDDVIRLSSKENITIKLRHSTPSTEEIREGCNIKVQDEDGQTLYERRDYKKIDKNRMHFVKDMYRDSQVQRISTSDAEMILNEKPPTIPECKSDTSLSNVIEINLNLKFKQADKTKDVNMNNSMDTLTREHDDAQVNTSHKSSKHIYVLQDKSKLSREDAENRDVNIKIMIKNYKVSSKLIPTNKQNVTLSATDEFAKKISEKFQTVSTGYSDTIETYSVHRTTIDLATSDDNNNNLSKHSLLLTKKDYKHTNYTDKNIEVNKNKSQVISTSNEVSQIEVNTSLEKTDATNDDDKDDKSATSVSIMNSEQHINSDGKNIIGKNNLKNKKYNKEQKRKIFKELLQRASELQKNKNKNEIKEIHQLLRNVLTSDSSDHDDFEDNKHLPENLTYSSLKPNYLKGSNSMTNYYLDKSSMSTKVSSKFECEEVIHPTKNVSECSISNTKGNMGCVCSHLATKLNLTPDVFPPCCCRGFRKVNEDINCDINDDEEKSINITVETQYSEQMDSTYAASKREVFKEKLIRSILPQKQFRCCQLKDPDNPSGLESTDVKKVVETNSKFDCLSNNIAKVNKKVASIKAADVLQLNETKKAVLEIYAERNISNGAKHMIARLPKFVCGRESEIYHYEKTYAYRRFDK